MSRTTREDIINLAKKYGITDLSFADYLEDESQFYGCQIILDNSEIEITDEMEREFAEIGVSIWRSRGEMEKELAPSLFGEEEHE